MVPRAFHRPTLSPNVDGPHGGGNGTSLAWHCSQYRCPPATLSIVRVAISMPCARAPPRRARAATIRLTAIAIAAARAIRLIKADFATGRDRGYARSRRGRLVEEGGEGGDREIMVVAVALSDGRAEDNWVGGRAIRVLDAHAFTEAVLV